MVAIRVSEVRVEDIKAVFFRAMLKGWAFGFKPIPVEDSPGLKRVEYPEGDWFVRDEYSTTRGQRSGGVTRIWFRSILVWEMHYWGQYEERAIPILKTVLREAYEHDWFHGGRGHDFAKEGLLYENSYSGTFKDFMGRERVIDVAHGGQSLGYHQYAGMLMVDLPLHLEGEDEL
jgi:hypothetical protein